MLVVARESGALEMLEVTEQTPAHAWLRDKTDQADGKQRAAWHMAEGRRMMRLQACSEGL